MFLVKDFDSIFDLLKRFPDEESCIKHLEFIRWNDTPVSPFAQGSKVYVCKGGKYKCKDTGKYFTVKTGTIFEGSNIPMQKWFMAIFMIISHKKGISSYQMAKDIGVTQKTAWFLLQRIRHVLGEDERDNEMEGAVEADETFVGGKNKNRHKDKKVKNSQGRSFKDKTPVLGLIERQEYDIIERPHKVIPDKIVQEKVITKRAKVFCKVVPDTKASTIQPVIKSVVKNDTVFMSDEWCGYAGLSSIYNHQIVNHGAKQYVDGDIYTNTIEGFWTILKKGVIGIYNAPTRKHLQKYVDEYAYRYRTRELRGFSRFNDYLCFINTRLTYKNLIKTN